MDFSYRGYENMIKLLKQHNYSVATYQNYKNFDKCVILRHDIDYDLKKSLELAELENKLGVKSTYFVLLTSDFYNVFSNQSLRVLEKLRYFGHDIGLHFDELNYPDIISIEERIKEKIIYETNLLSSVLNIPIKSVSMHRPSKAILEADLQIPNIINSYSHEFFHNFKYLSDSRRNWREPVEEIIAKETFNRLHILTHAFWYHEKEIDMKSTLIDFLNSANKERHIYLSRNFTKLSDVLKGED